MENKPEVQVQTVRVTLPDGSVREVPKGTTAASLAASIGRGLAKAALACELDGALVDLSTPIDRDCPVRIITFDDPEGKEIYRHSSSHIMAQAVKELFPDVKVAIGPAIEDGFYYDFERSTGFTPEDLEKIEKRMAVIIKAAKPFVRSEKSKEDALKQFGEMGETYKAEIISEIPDDTVSLYDQQGFTDLCRGPHVPDTGRIKAFKLINSAGAYWRGDEKNKML